MRLKDLTPATIRGWVGGLNRKTPRLNEHVYALLKTIFATAVQDELLDRNPCRERMRKPMRHIGEPATLDELALYPPPGSALTALIARDKQLLCLPLQLPPAANQPLSNVQLRTSDNTQLTQWLPSVSPV